MAYALGRYKPRRTRRPYKSLKVDAFRGNKIISPFSSTMRWMVIFRQDDLQFRSSLQVSIERAPSTGVKMFGRSAAEAK